VAGATDSPETPFSVSQVPLRPISHMAGFLVRAVPVFEIRNTSGNDTDMLIRDKELGAALAKTLGNGTVVLMRGHGDVVVGDSIKTAVLHAVYTDLDARLESEALKLGGKITFLNESEAAKIGMINDSQVERPWDLWKRNAQSRDSVSELDQPVLAGMRRVGEDTCDEVGLTRQHLRPPYTPRVC
jgi:ribulose-5-phosphate 4-epimerase/fuculose-1-phosphate aldolase